MFMTCHDNETPSHPTLQNNQSFSLKPGKALSIIVEALSTQSHHPYMRPSPNGSFRTNT